MTDEPLFDESAIPSQNPNVDVNSVSEPPSSDEFFLYSRIDGSQSVKQLCNTSGLGRKKTMEGLEKLFRVGLIDVPGAQRPEPEPEDVDEDESLASHLGDESGGLGAASSDVLHKRPIGETSSVVDLSERSSSSVVESDAGDESSAASEASSSSDSGQEDAAEETSPAGDEKSSLELTGIDLSHLPVPPAEFDFDEDLLEQDLPIDVELRRELLCLHEQIDDLTHYQFFGLERDASRGEIKKAYFQLSKRYHPDKHFRKEIGPFRKKLERVFQKITRAYRTLSNSGKREEYDAELAEREAADATPMTQPSTVRMAHESSNGGRPKIQKNETDKRAAAFAKLVRQGEKLRKNGDYVRASESYRKALSLKRDIKVAIQAARVLLQAGEQFDQAELFARAALRIDGERVEARVLLGQALEKLGRPEAALDAYAQVLELEPDHKKAKMRSNRIRNQLQ